MKKRRQQEEEQEEENDLNKDNPQAPLHMTVPSFPVVPRRDRIHVLVEFLQAHFDFDSLRRQQQQHGYILDIAGGKGDLSFVLTNGYGLKSVIVDPRWPEHDKLARTCLWYHEHPVETVQQGREGQYLARLALAPPFAIPRHLRLYFESHGLLAALQSSDSGASSNEWHTYWQQAQATVARMETAAHHAKKHWDKPTIPVQQHQGPVACANEAWEIFQHASLVIGWHPDQATDACIDFALARRLPFVVCPCCVFTSLFPQRRLRSNGQPIRNFDQYVQFLSEKDPRIRVGRLPFSSPATGDGAGLARNTVLYVLPQDYDNKSE